MRHNESKLQQLCVSWFRLQYPKYSKLLASSLNGVQLTKLQAIIAKAEGMVSGVADLSLSVPRGGYHALYIEMKTLSGRQSPNQREWQRLVEEQGYLYVICRTFEEFQNKVNRYLSL